MTARDEEDALPESADSGDGDIAVRTDPAHALFERPRHELVEQPRDPFVDESGELRPAEVLFRGGLLLGAALFMGEGIGAPWTRGVFSQLAALLMAALIILTMAMQWRVLGDWRRGSQQLLLCLLTLTLIVPLAGVLSPSMAASALPAELRDALVSISDSVRRIPGLGQLVLFIQGVVLFLFYLGVVTVLILSSGPTSRAGFAVIAALTVALTLFLYPSAETVVGLVLLGFFFRVQWEVPVLVPDVLRPHLGAAQMEFLRELTRSRGLSTLETRIILRDNAKAFGDLIDAKLVDFDPVTRSVHPGQRLLHDPAAETVETALLLARRSIWIGLGIAYFLLPDPIPGYFDDLIVLAICTGAGMGWFPALFARRGTR